MCLDVLAKSALKYSIVNIMHRWAGDNNIPIHPPVKPISSAIGSIPPVGSNIRWSNIGNAMAAKTNSPAVAIPIEKGIMNVTRYLLILFWTSIWYIVCGAPLLTMNS